MLSAPIVAALASPTAALAAPDDDTAVEVAVGTAAADARDLGREAFGAGDFERAAAHFEYAYHEDPDPTDLYNLGRIHEEIGKLPEALQYYEEFAGKPGLSLQERRAATERIEVLRVAVQPTPPAPRVSSADAGSQPPPSPPVRGTNDRLATEPGRALIIGGGALVGVGAALAIGSGVGFGMAARRASDQIDDLASGRNPDRLSLAAAEDLQARGRDLETLQISLAITGGVVAAAGAGLLATGIIRRNRSRQLTLTPTLAPATAGMHAGWRF